MTSKIWIKNTKLKNSLHLTLVLPIITKSVLLFLMTISNMNNNLYAKIIIIIKALKILKLDHINHKNLETKMTNNNSIIVRKPISKKVIFSIMKERVKEF